MNAADIKVDEGGSFLLVGDGGTHKTFFISTCPRPSYTFSFDKGGMNVNRGKDWMDYDEFKEVPRIYPGSVTEQKKQGELYKLTDAEKANGWYEWGTAWPAFLKKLNDMGRSIDRGECKYKTFGLDSITTLSDAVTSFIKKGNATSENPEGEYKDGRQFWGEYLNKMSLFFDQFSSWPVNKVVTAHVKRDDNLLAGTIEKLPLISGQFGGKIGIYFDEVYYTEVKVENVGTPPVKKETFTFRCHQDGTIKMAKSRKFNLPDGLPTDFNAIMEWVKKNAGKAA